MRPVHAAVVCTLLLSPLLTGCAASPDAVDRAAAREPGLSREPAGSGGLPRFGQYVAVDVLPEAVEKVAPEYPDSARAQGVEGTVMVEALVGKDGLVRDVRIAESVPGLDSVAATAIRQWRFKPAMAKRKPVAVWVGLPVKFSLH